MHNKDGIITVFEHEIIRFDKGEKRISIDQYHALQKYYGNGTQYFDLCYNGIRFKEFVGIIQIGRTLIEVLPKADVLYNKDKNPNSWRDILIGMLKAIESFEIKATSYSNLKIYSNSILDLYINLFLQEVEVILHHGIVKKYRQIEENLTALKGKLLIEKNLKYNLFNQGRFFVNHTQYNSKHIFHFILYKSLLIVKAINTNESLKERIKYLTLIFPEMPDIEVTESVFDRLIYNRKTEIYRKAIDFAKMIILNYHPDTRQGQNHVLAIMFDMNKLWEKFIFISLRKNLTEAAVVSQSSKRFWKSEYRKVATIRPDIIIKWKGKHYVLDTKWKSINSSNISPNDLRQMFVYNKYFNSKKAALVYPGIDCNRTYGIYLDPFLGCDTDMTCSLIPIEVEKNIKEWQKKITQQICCFIGDS